MWNTSDRYKELIYNINKKCLLNVYIEDTLIDDNDIIDFRISHNLFSSDKVELGSTPSKVIEFQIKASALPEKYDNFYIETGLNIDGVDEIVPIGYFILEEIEKDDDCVTITAVDYMMNFERVLNVYKALPCTAINLLKYICNYCGVELGSTSFLNSDIIINKYDTSMTARQMIGYIAEQAGGFACIGRDGKLYIKTIGNNTTEIDIELFVDYKWGEKFICNEVDFDNEEQQYYISDTEINGAELDNILDAPLYNNVEGQNIEINPNNFYIRSEEQVKNIYNNLKNLQLYGFEGQSIIDPAVDIGDIIYIENKPIIYQGDMEFVGKFKGNISSKIETEQKKSTTVGSSLSYATRMRNLKGQVQETQEQVAEFEKTKVDKDNIIQTINESNNNDKITKISSIENENNKTINPEKINLNGYSSPENDNFYVDKNGRVHCKDIEIKSGQIELEDDGAESNPSLIIRHQDEKTEYNSSFNSYNTTFFNRTYSNGYRETNEGNTGGNFRSISYEKDIYNENTQSYIADVISYINEKATDEEVCIEIKNNYDMGKDEGIEIKSSIDNGSEIIIGQDPEIDDRSEEINYKSTGSKISTYQIVTPILIQTSSEKIKKNIENFENALDIIKNSEIYKYNLKFEHDNERKHIGFIIGKKYNTPHEVIAKSGKGIDTYSMTSILWRGLQELIEKDIKKDEEIQNLKNILQDLQSKVQKLLERS